MSCPVGLTDLHYFDFPIASEPEPLCIILTHLYFLFCAGAHLLTMFFLDSLSFSFWFVIALYIKILSFIIDVTNIFPGLLLILWLCLW